MEQQGEFKDMHEDTKPIENQLYLIPPSIQNKFTCESESPSNDQDGLINSNKRRGIPLKVRCVSWNHARTQQKP